MKIRIKIKRNALREPVLLDYEELKKTTTFKERVWLSCKNPDKYMKDHLKEVDELLTKKKKVVVKKKKGLIRTKVSSNA